MSDKNQCPTTLVAFQGGGAKGLPTGCSKRQEVPQAKKSLPPMQQVRPRGHFSAFTMYRRDTEPNPNHNHTSQIIPASLNLPDGVSVSRTALVCFRELNIEEWQAIGCTLREFENSAQWWIGDWWHYGYFHYGQRKAITTAKNALGRAYAFGTLMNLGYVAGRIETSFRNEVLSWTHHYHVAKLEPEGQKYWLDLAARDGLSVSKLRIEMFKAKREIHNAEMAENDPSYANEECVREYYCKLERVALPAYIVPPWKDREFERYLEDNFFRRTGLMRKAEEQIEFWTKLDKFVRRIHLRVQASRLSESQNTPADLAQPELVMQGARQ